MDPKLRDALDESVVQRIASDVLQYWKDHRTTVSLATIQAEMATFQTRSDVERQQTFETYWKSKVNILPFVSKFVAAVDSVLVTEAGVERTFQQQGDIWTKVRSLLGEEMRHELLFIKFNYKRIQVLKGKALTATSAPILQKRHR